MDQGTLTVILFLVVHCQQQSKKYLNTDFSHAKYFFQNILLKTA